MAALAVVSVLWALSFGLVKGLGGLDSAQVAAVRLALSLLVFLPLFRPREAGGRSLLRLAAVGAVQFGAMYLLYLRSYAYLQAHEVALFTVTTPIWVAALDAALCRRLRMAFVWAAALSVAGAAAIVWRPGAAPHAPAGFALVQLSNLCFAAGQVAWRRERGALAGRVSEASVFAAPLAGALLTTLAFCALGPGWRQFQPTAPQWASLAYLGVVASGAGFFLWNWGASRVNAGVLAAMNNAKVPLGVAFSIAFFGERAEPARLAAGALFLGAGVWLAGAAGGYSKESPQVRRA